jgi:hypothetical protein
MNASNLLLSAIAIRNVIPFDVIYVCRNEGAIGYFRGVVPNALKVTPASAVTFLVYEETMKMLKTL